MKLDVSNLLDNSVSKVETEIVDKQKKEYKYIHSMRKIPGLSCYAFNTRTKEISKVSTVKKLHLDIATGLPMKVEKAEYNPECIYIQALNEKNVIKKLKKQGLI